MNMHGFKIEMSNERKNDIKKLIVFAFASHKLQCSLILV